MGIYDEPRAGITSSLMRRHTPSQPFQAAMSTSNSLFGGGQPPQPGAMGSLTQPQTQSGGGLFGGASGMTPQPSMGGGANMLASGWSGSDMPVGLPGMPPSQPGAQPIYHEGPTGTGDGGFINPAGVKVGGGQLQAPLAQMGSGESTWGSWLPPGSPSPPPIPFDPKMA